MFEHLETFDSTPSNLIKSTLKLFFIILIQNVKFFPVYN